MIECEALILGREAIRGTANAATLATLVRNLSKKSSEGTRRKYVLGCSVDGVQWTQTREDEGFESDEELTSLASFEDRTCQSSPEGTTSASVSSADSANSSGASDNDESVSDAAAGRFPKASKVSEIYSYNDIAFCHTDPTLPKIIVWVTKTREQKDCNASFNFGLEAVVFQCKNEESFKKLRNSYQESSRRAKLGNTIKRNDRYKSSEGVFTPKTTKITVEINPIKKTFPSWSTSVANLQPPNDESPYNLVQRTDNQGITYLEVTRSLENNFRQSSRDSEPGSSGKVEMPNENSSSNIISIDTPDSGNVNSQCGMSDSKGRNLSTFAEWMNSDGPPMRPERKKDILKKNMACNPPLALATPFHKTYQADTISRASQNVAKLNSKISGGGGGAPFSNKDPKSTSSRRTNWMMANERRPCSNILSYSVVPVWPTTALDGRDHYLGAPYGSRKYYPAASVRSRSTGPSLRGTGESSPMRYPPMQYRYVDTLSANNSFPNRFFGKLKDLTIGTSARNNSFSHRSRRRNSIGDLANSRFFQHCDVRPLHETPSSITKSTPNLKSVIKNKNGKFNGRDENYEPKKVTFSAYATVQVVD